MLNRRSFLKTTSVAVAAITIGSMLAEGVWAQTAESRPADDSFEVDSVNAVRQFLEHGGSHLGCLGRDLA
jgi:hypothetical protein